MEDDTTTRDISNTPQYLISETVDAEYLTEIANLPYREQPAHIYNLLAEDSIVYKKEYVHTVFNTLKTSIPTRLSSNIYSSLTPLQVKWYLGTDHCNARELSGFENRDAYREFLTYTKPFSVMELRDNDRVHFFAKSVYLSAYPHSGETFLGQVIEQQLSSFRNYPPLDEDGKIVSQEMYECNIDSKTVQFETGIAYAHKTLSYEKFKFELDKIKMDDYLYDSLISEYSSDEYTPSPITYAYIGLDSTTMFKDLKRTIEFFSIYGISTLAFDLYSPSKMFDNSMKESSIVLNITDSSFGLDGDTTIFYTLFEDEYQSYNVVADSLNQVEQIASKYGKPIFSEDGEWIRAIDTAITDSIFYSAQGDTETDNIKLVKADRELLSQTEISVSQLITSKILATQSLQNQQIVLHVDDSVPANFVVEILSTLHKANIDAVIYSINQY